VTPQVQKLPGLHQSSKKDQKIFEMPAEELTKSHFSRFIAIEVDSGDYFIGEAAIEATQRAQARHPEKIFFLGRMGYRTACTFKGHRGSRASFVRPARRSWR
jgi:hypothetical protein